MSDCRWYEIDSFASTYDAASFESYLDRQVAEGRAEEVHCAASRTKHFRCTSSGEVWALAKPAADDRGNWRPVAHQAISV